MAHDDDFDDARSGFVKQEDLMGRLLLVKAFEVGERVSTGQYAGTDPATGKPKVYEYVVTETVILDGDVTDLIDRCGVDVYESFVRRLQMEADANLQKMAFAVEYR